MDGTNFSISARDIIKMQLSMVEKIVSDEAWYEGERRRCQVDHNDRIVQKRVREVIMRCGHEMREEAKRRLMEGLNA